MFNLTLALFISIQSMAGVGGVAGGNVLFQKESTYISLNDRTLCHNGVHYRAVIKKCTRWNDKNQNACRSSEEKEIFQPIISVKQGCVGLNLERCSEWKELPFIQSPQRKVEIVGSNSRLLGHSIITVPSCF